MSLILAFPLNAPSQQKYFKNSFAIHFGQHKKKVVEGKKLNNSGQKIEGMGKNTANIAYGYTEKVLLEIQ